MTTVVEETIGGRTLSIETGRMAKQADGAVFVQYGDSAVLVAAMSEKEVTRDLGFFPLTIEYRERTYAAGKIPGGFFKREGRPTTKEILTNEVFKWDPVDDKFIYSGKSYILERVRAEKDKTREEMTNEIKNRAKLLEWMNRNNVREFKKVATLISQYFDNPEQVMKKISVDT